jgi:hypothetical protein
MKFELFADTTPQEIPLKLFYTIVNALREWKKGQKISRQLERVLLLNKNVLPKYKWRFKGRWLSNACTGVETMEYECGFEKVSELGLF